MSNSARMEVLDNHSRACWNVWQEHMRTCAGCEMASEDRALPNEQCLVGTAAYEEWCIADCRCSIKKPRSV